MAADRYCCMQSNVAVKQLMQHGATKHHLLPRQCGIKSCSRHYKSAAPGLQYYITRYRQSGTWCTGKIQSTYGRAYMPRYGPLHGADQMLCAEALSKLERFQETCA